MNDIAKHHLDDKEPLFNCTIYPDIIFRKLRCVDQETPGLDKMKIKDKKKGGGCFKQFVVVKSCRFFDLDQNYLRLVIPEGFITDFASIPKFLWSIIPAQGLATNPSIIHDYLYVYGIGIREEADDIFRRLLLSEGVSKFQTFLMWKAVRMFGKGRFDRKVRATEAVVDINKLKLTKK